MAQCQLRHVAAQCLSHDDLNRNQGVTMKTVLIDSPFVEIGAGTLLRLSKAQAGPRSHNLEVTKEPDIYRTLSSVQFKRGEEIGIDGELGKGFLPKVIAEEAKVEVETEDGGSSIRESAKPIRKPGRPAGKKK